MAKKKRIGMNGRLSIIAQAIIDYAEEGGRYALETEPGFVVIVLDDVELKHQPEQDTADGVPAYKLVYIGDAGKESTAE